MLDQLRSLAFGSPVTVGKALDRPPEGLPNFGLQGSGRTRLAGKAGARHIQAYGGTDAIDWVMDCVDLISQTASNAEYHFERNGSRLTGLQTFGQLLDDGTAPPDLTRLFERPNPFQDYTELLELAIIDFLLAGEFMWLKFKMDDKGRPLALYRLAPPLIEVELNKSGYPDKYIYTLPGGKPVEYDPAEVLHVKRPNPHNPWRGLGVIAGAPRMYDLELAQVENAAAYYERGTRLSGVLESERSVPDSTWQKIKRQFIAMWSGKENAYSVAMLQKGIKYNPISNSAADAMMVEMMEQTKARIAKAFRVPLPMLGEVGSSVDRQAAREAQRVFDNKTMRPFLNRLQSQISLGLTQAWDVDFKIDYEYEMPIEDKVNLASGAGAIPGLQVRDLRALMDLPPLEATLGPAGKEIDDIVLNLPGEDQADGGHADPPLKGEPGRKPKRESTRAFPRDGKLPGGTAAIQPRRSAKALLDDIQDVRDRIEGGEYGTEA